MVLDFLVTVYEARTQTVNYETENTGIENKPDLKKGGFRIEMLAL